VPFIAMARARGWRLRRTLGITAACGVGHLTASLVLGALGVAAGLALSDLESVQVGRGRLAGWLLIGFGLVYTARGVRRAIARRPHGHWHAHADGTVHRHEHRHAGGHLHCHAGPGGGGGAGAAPRPTITPWILFVIFLFGPCEPLIPLLMVPAAAGSAWQAALVVGAFSVATLAAMLGAVTLGLAGARQVRAAPLERWSDALAGAAVTVCGVAVHLGL
jgi:sulfite exporter TauE/SafE